MDNSPIWKTDVQGDTISFNLFGSWGGNIFNKIASAFVKKQVNDGVFAVFSHGTQSSVIKNHEMDANHKVKVEYMSDPADIVKELSKQNKDFKAAMKSNKPITLVLYACMTGSSYTYTDENGKDINNTVPIGQKISEQYPNITVVAPDGDVNYTKNNTTGEYKLEGVTDANGTGGYVTFKKGEKVSKTFKAYDPKNGIRIGKGEKIYAPPANTQETTGKKEP